MENGRYTGHHFTGILSTLSRCDLFRKESKLKKATTRKQGKKKEFVQTNVYNVQNTLKILKSTRKSMMGFIVNDENKEKANFKKKEQKNTDQLQSHVFLL